MTSMNQSFIRAFAKKDAAANTPVSAPTATKKVQQRMAPAAAIVAKPNPASPTIVAESLPSMGLPSSVARLLNSESVLVYSDYSEAPSVGAITEPRVRPTWSPEMAKAAQSAAAEVPRGVAAKSTIPAPPKSPPKEFAEPHFEAKNAVQRIDDAHHGKALLPSVMPAWEVDKLLWPRTCDQLLAAEKPYFEEAARRLVEASKQGMRTLAICESRRGEGCSTVALCVAKAAAAAGLRIGILDADFQSDGLCEMLGLEVECDWTLIADDAAAIHENCVQVLDQPITLFPMSGDASHDAVKSAAKQSKKQLSLIPQIADQFDLLIVDFGAFGEGALPLALKAKVNIDAALVVRDLRHTSSRAVHVTVGQIRESGIEAVGIAENFGAR